MNDKIKLLLLVVPLGILVGYSWFFVVPYYFEEDVLSRAWEPVVLGSAWAVGITIVSILIVMRSYSGVRRGLPLNDERSKMIVLKAGFFSFMLSIGWWVLLNAIVISNTRTFGAPALDQAPEALFGGLLMLPVIFFAVWSYLTYKHRPGAA